MLKLIASMSLAALISLSPAFAKPKPEPKSPPVVACALPLAKAAKEAPPETSRISGDAFTKFVASIKAKAARASDAFPDGADTVVFFRVNDKITAMAITKGDCVVKLGFISTVLVPGEQKPEDGSI